MHARPSWPASLGTAREHHSLKCKLFSCRGYRRLVAPNSSIRTSCGLSVVSFCLLSNILALTCVPPPNGDMMAIGAERASLVVCRASCHADIFILDGCQSRQGTLGGCDANVGTQRRDSRKETPSFARAMVLQ